MVDVMGLAVDPVVGLPGGCIITTQLDVQVKGRSPAGRSPQGAALALNSYLSSSECLATVVPHFWSALDGTHGVQLHLPIITLQTRGSWRIEFRKEFYE